MPFVKGVSRDLTRTEFARALTRHGLRPSGFGLFSVDVAGTPVLISHGYHPTRRAQLAHLINESIRLRREAAGPSIRR